MDYQKVLKQFDAVAAAKGNDKKPLLQDYLQEPDFLKVTTYILDSSKTFKMGKVKEADKISDKDLFDFLDELDSKPGATKQDKNLMAEIASVSPEKFIIVNKILRHKTDAGFTGRTIEKLSPGLIPYFPYMRCKGLAHLKNIVFPCYSQIKADGMYHEHLNKEFRTRNGKLLDFSLVPEENKATTINDYRLMGECLLLNEAGTDFMDRRDGNAIINKAQHSGLSQEEADRVRFQYWDVDAGFAHQIPYSERFDGVEAITGGMCIESRIVNNMEEAWQHYDEVRAKGLEGTILKNFDGLWKDGNSSDQIKLKAVLSAELKVVDIVPGEDKYEGMIGSLICESSCKGLLTKVGMGLTDEDRLMKGWVGKIVEVKFNEVSKSKAKDTHALSHARLVEPREDKTEADTLKYILELKEVKRK